MNSMTDMNDSWRLWCSVSWRIHVGQSNFGLSKTISPRNSRYCPGHVGSQYFFPPLDSSCQWYGNKDKYYPHVLYPLEMYYTYIPCLIPNAPILKISGGGGCRVWFHTWLKNMVLNTIWWHTSGPHGCTSKVRSSASSGRIRFCSLMFFSLFLWKRCNGFPSH